MIVAGGGTGGHLFPGLAVAEAVAADGHAQVLFVGSAYGIEAKAIPRTQFPFRSLAIRGLRGRGWRGALTFAWQLPLALVQAWRIVARFRPTLVLGLGGYGSVPVVLAAWVRRVPTVLMEQNVHPGFANRLLGHLARRVCTAFADSARFFPAGRTVQTGNPVRILRTDIQPAATHFTLFVFGGSQGAHTINVAAVEAARIASQQLCDLHVIHQTGTADAEWVEQRYQGLGVEAQVVPFVYDMANAYGRADLVVCRAGATTLAELAALGKPAILIPYPFAADDHQRTNAEVLVRHGAAELIADAELTAERLAARVVGLARDRHQLKRMGEAVRQLAVPDAALRVAAVCRQVAAEGG
ncbi:MAG TPA: undecaprenyldiphospho-muramoylpentapeptide beta-N-acetylglucosaminyltransferase [Candidatus Margulisiibacteriota bacterium]|nr:undecaprenyldiphospho-muramoylpentapeptide beta-N-acetylglucosaminyltransferase [Candidatus Margulisiibacteriota bacterium]